MLIYFFEMSSELELLQIAISHLKEDVEELQTDHEWCVKMNEAVENSYIPIPKIDLSKLHEQTDLYFNVNIFKNSSDLSNLLHINSDDNILWNSINFLKFSFKNATEINILNAYKNIINNTGVAYQRTDTTITLSKYSSGLLLNVFKPKDYDFISINVAILTNLHNYDYDYNLLRFDQNNGFHTLLGCNYYDTKLVKKYEDTPQDGFKDMSIIKSYWLPLNIDSYSNKSVIDKFNIINGENKLKYVTTTGSLNPTEVDIDSSIWLPYQIGLYYQMSKKYMNGNTFSSNAMSYAPIRILERFECRTVLNFTDDNYIFFNMMLNSRSIRTLNINNDTISTKYDYLDGENIIKPLVNGEIILIQETKPNDISEVFFK